MVYGLFEGGQLSYYFNNGKMVGISKDYAATKL